MTDNPETLADEFERLLINERGWAADLEEFGVWCTKNHVTILSALRSADSAYARGREDMRREAAAVAEMWAKTNPVHGTEGEKAIAGACSFTAGRITDAILALPPAPEAEAQAMDCPDEETQMQRAVEQDRAPILAPVVSRLRGMLATHAAKEWPIWWTRNIEDAIAALDAQSSAIDEAVRAERFLEALTPSAATKAAYSGEFVFPFCMGEDPRGEDVFQDAVVPWVTIKKIMAAIRSRATTEQEKRG